MKENYPSHREILGIAGPMILTNISIPLLGIVDTAVLGHLPDPTALGAVAIGSMVFSFVFWGFGFLRMGTTGFVARCYGAGDSTGVTTLLYQALLLAVACAIGLLLAGDLILGAALGITEATLPIESGAAVYFEIRIMGAPMTLATHAMVGWFLGTQNARLPMLMLLTANLTNVVLDLLFVVGFGWGVAGVAWASVTGEVLGVVVGLGWIYGRYRPGRPQWARILQWEPIVALVRVNTDIMIRTFFLILVFAFIPWWGAQLGPAILAANAVLINFQHFTSYALDGFAHAAEAMAGRALGAGVAADFSRVVRRTGLWSLGVALLFAGAYLAFGELIVAGLTDIPSVRGAALDYLPWMVLLPVVSVWSFWLDGVFIGASWAREMLFAMAISAVAAFLPAWWLTRDFGNHGLWFAFSVFMLARALTMAVYYRLRAPDEGRPARSEGI
ncbi:MAG: MATE family efflux transporter [Xanthomonadales bacterium]|nr:MATE family efflux transporter [Xanthomonadales bacterium]